MSIETVPPRGDSIRLLLTEPHPCSYLDDRQCHHRLLSTPNIVVDKQLYGRHEHHGFSAQRYIIFTRPYAMAATPAYRRAYP